MLISSPLHLIVLLRHAQDMNTTLYDLAQKIQDEVDRLDAVSIPMGWRQSPCILNTVSLPLLIIQEKERRLEVIEELTNKINRLSERVGCPGLALESSDISNNFMENLRQEATDREDMVKARFEQVRPLVEAIRSMWEELEEEPKNDFELTIKRGDDLISLTDSSILALKNLHASVSFLRIHPSCP